MFPELIIDDELRLVPISPRFREDIFREFNQDIITYLLVDAPPSEISDTDKFISQSIGQMKSGSDIVWVILYKENFAGCCGIHNIPSRQPHFGLWLKNSIQGKGIGYRITSAGMNWAVANLPIDYIRYPVDENNIRSIRLIEKLTTTVYRCYKMGDKKVLRVNEYRIYPEKS